MARIRSITPETPDARWRRADLELDRLEYAVYHLWADGSTLLYVGVTGDPIERWRRHALRKPWWPQVTVITYRVFVGLDVALAAEKSAIQAERPVHNVQHALVGA